MVNTLGLNEDPLLILDLRSICRFVDVVNTLLIIVHLISLSNDVLLIIWSDNTFSIVDPFGQSFDFLNTFLMVVSLP